MKISTKGRYALRVILDLAEHSNGEYIAMKEVAARQNISLKYLEKILPTLVKADLIEGVHGKGGGYRLTRELKDYPIGEILRAAEGGDLAPVSCLESGAEKCQHTADCKTLPLWLKLNCVINDFLDSQTIEDLIHPSKK